MCDLIVSSIKDLKDGYDEKFPHFNRDVCECHGGIWWPWVDNPVPKLPWQILVSSIQCERLVPDSSCGQIRLGALSAAHYEYPNGGYADSYSIQAVHCAHIGSSSKQYLGGANPPVVSSSSGQRSFNSKKQCMTPGNLIIVFHDKRLRTLRPALILRFRLSLR